MSNNAHDKAAQEEHFADIFARLRDQDIEQFYAHYQLWVLRRRLPLIENQLEILREHLAENQQATESLRPSALALAVLVRLQSNGVNDTDLLDLMLDRGEDWLDRMMQRLDYCEQVEDFIQGDYTQWCIKSLEGAYDWIDSLLGSIKENTGRRENSASDNATTEEQLLQKLSLDEEDTLEITLKQSTAQPEVATEDSGETLVVETTPENEQESIPLPDTQSAEADANSEETADQPELASPLDESAELQENDEDEPQPELFGWKDLEDLEAPEGHPMPWYSVNVTEDGATSTSLEAEQTVTMNDWIQVLQADTTASTETDATETSPDHAAELSNSTEQAEATEIHTPATASDAETSALSTKPEDVPTSDPEAAEQASTADAQSEDEAISPVEAEIAQEQNIPLLEETLSTAQINDELANSLEETPIAAQSNDELANSLEETSSTAQSNDEIVSSLEETSSAETNIDELALSLTANSVPESSDNESEILLTEDKLAEVGTGENAASEVTLNPEQAEDEAGQFTEEHADTREELELASSIQEADEQMRVAEKINNEEVDEEVAPGERKQAENGEPQSQAEESLPSADTLVKQPETPVAEHTQESAQETQRNEIETAAIANDILSSEDEPEEQLAWYEYLDLEEPTNNVAHSTREEHIGSEESSAISSGKPAASEADASPAIHEDTAVEERANEQEQALPLHSEEKIAAEVSEIEDWQSWNTPEVDDETLPFALKEIQLAHQSQASDVPQDATSETREPQDTATPAQPEPGHAAHLTPAISDEMNRRGTIAEQVTQQMPITPPVQTLRPTEPPPKKPGFWRRLFSFGRKKKR
ncbi:MAG TPA: hypothetical protein VN729_13565 [Ktedonobacteraceae bacterium]|nr:hypothetical protein [Ktedonobacteraceae bacterium]